jgi:hypothetical protein
MNGNTTQTVISGSGWCASIVFDLSDNLYCVSPPNGCVTVYNSNYVQIRQVCGFNQPYGGALDYFGNFYVNDRNRHSIVRINANDSFTTIATGHGWIFGVSVYPEIGREIYFSGESGFYKIQVRFHIYFKL